MKNKGEIILCIGTIAVALAIVSIALKQCDGTLVRGLFWYECIKGE